MSFFNAAGGSSAQYLRPYRTPSGQQTMDVRLADFSGGLVAVPDVKGAAQLGDSQSPKMQNVDTSGKSVRKMRGFTTVTAGTVTGDISSLYYDKQTRTIFTAYNDKWGSLSGTSIVGLTGATGLEPNAVTSFCRLNDYIVGFNGTDVGKTWNADTSTFANITTPPVTWTLGNRPAFGSSWMGRVFAAGCDTDNDILFFSELYDPNAWTAGVNADSAGALRIGDDGKPITALIPLADALLIVKDSGLYALYGDQTYSTSATDAQFDQTTFTWNLLSDTVDCVGHRAWVITDDAMYIWGNSAVYKIMGTQVQQKVSVSILSDDIAPYVSQVINCLDQVCGVHYSDRKQIWFNVAKDSGSSTTDTVYIYDYKNSEWFIRNGYAHKCMANVRDGTGHDRIYSGGYSGGSYIYEQNVTNNYNGAAMECYYWTSWVPLGTAAHGKTNRVIFLLGSQTNGTIAYSYAYDFSEAYYDADTLLAPTADSAWNDSGTGATFGDTAGSGTTGTWTTGESFENVIPIFGRGRRIQHRFYSNLVDSDFDILEILHPVTSVGYA